MGKKSTLHKQRSRVGIIFATPALILVSAFLGIPIIQAGYFSFTEWNGIDAESTNGFDSDTYLCVPEAHSSR